MKQSSLFLSAWQAISSSQKLQQMKQSPMAIFLSSMEKKKNFSPLCR
jgi:hypothetical protein